MWKTKNSKILICAGIGISMMVIVCFFIMNQQTKTDEIKLMFNSNIEIEKNAELTKDILIKETNAEEIKVINGDTSKLGECEVVIEAKLHALKKEFSTNIKVVDKKDSNAEEHNEENKEKEDDESKQSEQDQPTDGVEKKTSEKQNKDESQNTTSSKPQDNSKPQNKPEKNDGNTPSTNKPAEEVSPKLSESQYAAQVFALINTYRTQQGLPSLGTNATIQSIANIRANDMAQMGYASHSRPDGTVADYLWIKNNFGIKAGGEDVFGGSQSFEPKAVVDSFINSSGHRAPIESDMNQYMAVAVKYSNGQVYVSVNFQQ